MFSQVYKARDLVIARRIQVRVPYFISLLIGVAIVTVGLTMPAHLSKNRLDFNAYYAGALAEKHTTFSDVNFISDYEKRNQLDRSKYTEVPPGTSITIALVFVPLSKLSQQNAVAIFLAISIVIFLSGIARVSGSSWPLWWLVALLFVELGEAFRLGNLSILISGLIAHAVADAMEGKEKRSCVWLVISSLLRITPALLLIPFVFSKRWRAFLTVIPVALIAVGSSILLIGWSDFLSGFKTTLLAARDVALIPSNKSIPGSVGFITSSSDIQNALTVLCLLAALLLLWKIRESQLSDCLAVASCLCFLASPVSWFHYASMLLPLAIIVFQRLDGNIRRQLGLACLFLTVPNGLFASFNRWAYRTLPWKLGYLAYMRATCLALLLLVVWYLRARVSEEAQLTPVDIKSEPMVETSEGSRLDEDRVG